jgi:hypothetical protein
MLGEPKLGPVASEAAIMPADFVLVVPWLAVQVNPHRPNRFGQLLVHLIKRQQSSGRKNILRPSANTR